MPGHAAIIGETSKPDGYMLDNIDVNRALGIMPDYISELNQVVIPKLINDIRTQIL
jgi:hypothetical protein